MNPYEFGAIWSGWCADAAGADAGAEAAIDAAVRRIQLDWRANWAAHGDAPEGWARYAALIRKLRDIVARYRRARCSSPTAWIWRASSTSLIPALHSPDLAAGSAGAKSVPDLGQARSTDRIARRCHPGRGRAHRGEAFASPGH